MVENNSLINIGQDYFLIDMGLFFVKRNSEFSQSMLVDKTSLETIFEGRWLEFFLSERRSRLFFYQCCLDFFSTKVS